MCKFFKRGGFLRVSIDYGRFFTVAIGGTQIMNTGWGLLHYRNEFILSLVE